MPDECDACVNPAKCGAEGRCAEYDSPLQPHTGRPRDASHPDAGQWGHPSQRPSVFDSEPASPPHTGEARVDSDTLHAIAQNAYNRALAPRDATCDPNDAMHEAVDAVLDALHEPAQPQPREGTRVESGTSIEEAERLAAIETDAVFGPAQPQPRGEGDDLAARLEGMAANPGHSWPVVSGVLREAASRLRASTHPEQSARVEAVKAAMTALRCWITVAEDQERTEPDPYNERPEVIGDSLAALHGLADAFGLERKTHPFDEPASPTPTEQGEARVKATVNLILEILDDYTPDSGLGTARQYVEHSLGTMGAGYRFEELLSAQTEQGEGDAGA